MDDYQFWLPSCLLAVFVFYWYGIRPYCYLKSQGIPGQLPLPFIGTLYGLLNQDVTKTHIRTIEDRKKYGKIYGGYLARIPFIITSDLELVKQIFIKQFTNFTDRLAFENPRPFDQMLLSSRGEKWKNVRHKLTPAFSGSKLKETLPLMNDCCDTLVKKMDKAAESGEPVNIHNWLQGLTMEVITSVAFGVRSASQTNEDDPLTNKARRVFDQKFSFLFSVVLPWPFSSLVQKYVFSEPMPGLCYLADVAREIIKLRKENKNFKRKDLLQLMLDSQDDENKNPLTEDEIVAQSCTFLIAGYETSSTCLGFLCYHLVVDSHVQDELHKEVDSLPDSGESVPSYETLNSLPYMDMVISETLRMYPPVVLNTRQCTKDTDIMGYHFNKGVSIAFPTYALHMDPEFWPDPKIFNPYRFSAEEKAKRNPMVYAPFGHGPRNCIGMRLAMMEMKLCLLRMLKHHRLEMCPQTKVPMEPVSRAILSVPNSGVILRIVKRDEKP